MTNLELLAPARNIEIGIAAIDCGADAVYIAGPKFGARQAAGNDIGDIEALCRHAHRFGARIFVALNTIIYEDELKEAREQLMAVQEAGADAVIVQDLSFIRLLRSMPGDFHLPLHASTQCAIRTPRQAAWLESLGFSRLILERELSLDDIREIREATHCELEFFVHGALCVCYSGQCYMSQMIAGRSANRGACIQACRSRYDLVDESGNVLVKDKALLSLKDYNLKDRIGELAEAGISSFKIEGRLKNGSYVRNVVRDYSVEIDNLIARSPQKYARASFGKVSGGFVPDLSKTFNRGYTQLFIDGKRGQWACMDAAKSMGEEIGRVRSLSDDKSTIKVDLEGRKTALANGDGFCFVAEDGSITGFRGDVCSGNTIRCKRTPSLFVGARLFRNISVGFEKEIDRCRSTREIPVSVDVSITRKGGEGFLLTASALSQDGRSAREEFRAEDIVADNQDRIKSLMQSQMGKSSGHYSFTLNKLEADSPLPLLSASYLNGIRRRLTEILDSSSCRSIDLYRSNMDTDILPYPGNTADYRQNISNTAAESVYAEAGAEIKGLAYEMSPVREAELMRTKYCIRHELGLCLRHTRDSRRLFLLNNGRKFALGFDCANCEMTVSDRIPQPRK
ncbi:MAG: peptidase U32 family protein [Candidatus Cryptobacteroides sp.]